MTSKPAAKISAHILLLGQTAIDGLSQRLEAMGHTVDDRLDGGGIRPDIVFLVSPASLEEALAQLKTVRAIHLAPMVVVGFGDDSPAAGAALDALGLPVRLPATPGDADLKLVIRMALIQARQAQDGLNELELAQERLVQSDRLASIGQLAAGVAHEINNPVGYISSNIGTLGEYIDDIFRLLDAYRVLEAGIEDSPTVAGVQRLREEIQLDFLREDLGSLVGECQEGVSRVRQIIEDLKDFSRAGEGEWEPVDLHRALARTLNIVHNELKYKADLVQELGDIPLVECQPSQINQVMMNLLVNAAQAIEGHGRIIVRTGCGEGQVWFEVEDSGHGIATDDLKHIFDPFFTTKPVGEGTGLGLSISYGIVQRHGGRIEVDSRQGQGACFRVVLPGPA